MTSLDSGSQRIYIGAAGWLHPHWHEQFYPEDLPEDWQLAYYGNEFPVVLIRQQEWQQGGEVDDWLDDTEDTPLFICELPLQQVKTGTVEAAEPYLEKISQLGQRCLGIICHVHNGVSSEELAELLQRCNQLAPSCVESDEPVNEGWQNVLQQQSTGMVWNKLDQVQPANGALLLAKPDADGLSLKNLRQWMENLLEYDDPQHKLVLILAGDKPDLELIRQAKVMLDLI